MELLAIVAIVLAIIALNTARNVRKELEREVQSLKKQLERTEPTASETAAIDVVEDAIPPANLMVQAAVKADIPAKEAPVPVYETASSAEAREQASAKPVPVQTENEKRPASVENLLAARWSVWIGGLALAFAGIFAVKYSIEEGLLSPAVRLSLATLFGLVLMAAGELMRRRTRPEVVDYFQSAMIPGILTAAGTVTLFGAIYVAHAFYAFIGAPSAFLLMGAASFATIALSLMHGQALAGLGLVGSMVTPALVSSQSPNPWALFSFLTIAWLANNVASRFRRWRIIPAMANAGLSGWVILYVTYESPFGFLPAVLPLAMMLAGIALVWPGNITAGTEGVFPTGKARRTSPWERLLLPPYLESVVTAVLGAGLASIAISVAGYFAPVQALSAVVATILGLFCFGATRKYAVFSAVSAAGLAMLDITVFSFQPAIGCLGFNNSAGILCPQLSGTGVTYAAFGLGIVPLCLSIFVTRKSVKGNSPFAIVWATIGLLLPFATGSIAYYNFGNYSFDLSQGIYGLALFVLFVAGAELNDNVLHRGRYRVARDLMLAGSWAALAYSSIMLTESLATTVALVMIGIGYLAAYRTIRNWPSLSWAVVLSALLLAGRIAWEPTIVGASHLSRTPVFNQLLAGYGLPAVMLVVALWMLRRSDDQRLRGVLEGLASIFCLLTIGILVRHAMNGGTLDSSVPTLSEQSVYSLLAIGGSITLMALDFRRPSIVFRTGSMLVGYISMLSIFVGHLITLNPYFSGEQTGRIVFFNLLLLGYLLPAIAYAVAAAYARNRRPRHYVVSLALMSALLAFSYVTLSVRRIYQGADISEWKGFLQSEVYTYSAVWLVLGVVLLVAGFKAGAKSIRLAAAVLIAVVVLKVFLFDVYNLGGLYRVISFVGLGVSLIGIGRFYQSILGALGHERNEDETGKTISIPEA